MRLYTCWPGGQRFQESEELRKASCETIRAVTAIRTEAFAYWRRCTLPYAEPAVRLLRRSDVVTFNVHIANVRFSLWRAMEEHDCCVRKSSGASSAACGDGLFLSHSAG